MNPQLQLSGSVKVPQRVIDGVRKKLSESFDVVDGAPLPALTASPPPFLDLYGDLAAWELAFGIPPAEARERLRLFLTGSPAERAPAEALIATCSRIVASATTSLSRLGPEAFLKIRIYGVQGRAGFPEPLLATYGLTRFEAAFSLAGFYACAPEIFVRLRHSSALYGKRVTTPIVRVFIDGMVACALYAGIDSDLVEFELSLREPPEE